MIQIKELDQWRKANKKCKYAESRNTHKYDEQKISSLVAQEFKACLANISMAEAKDDDSNSQATKTDGAFKLFELAPLLPFHNQSRVVTQ